MARSVPKLLFLLCVVGVTAQKQSSCGTLKPKNSTATVGKQLANITLDLPLNIPNIMAETCCSIASSWATRRSKNSTEPVGWTATVLGPSTKHKGQSSINCAAYDYGSSQKPASPHTIAGMTPPLAPFPPPPPTCATFKAWDTCPATRCFWTKGACRATPPIDCTYNCRPGHCPSSPMCVHLALNTSQFSTMKLIGNAGSFNETVLTKPTDTFTNDIFFSVSDGLASSLKDAHPFRYCSQFQATNDKNRTAFAEVAICVSLIGGGTQFDLQVAITHGLAYKPNWITSGNLVASVVIHDNTTMTTATAYEMQSTTPFTVSDSV